MQRMSRIMKRNVLTRRKKTKHGFFFMPSTRSILQKRKLRENVINNIIHACTSWNRWTIIKSIAEAILFISFPEIFMYYREVLSFYGLNQNASYMLVDKNICIYETLEKQNMESSLLLNLTDENFQRKTSRGPSLNSSCNHEAIKSIVGALLYFLFPNI